MNFPRGSIQLALTCAKEWDSGDKALNYYLDGLPENDERKGVWILRNDCYQLVFDTLEKVDESTSKDSAPRLDAYDQALRSKDELFHQALYDWFLNKGMNSQLLEVKLPLRYTLLMRLTLSVDRLERLTWNITCQEIQTTSTS